MKWNYEQFFSQYSNETILEIFRAKTGISNRSRLSVREPIAVMGKVRTCDFTAPRLRPKVRTYRRDWTSTFQSADSVLWVRDFRPTFGLKPDGSLATSGPRPLLADCRAVGQQHRPFMNVLQHWGLWSHRYSWSRRRDHFVGRAQYHPHTLQP